MFSSQGEMPSKISTQHFYRIIFFYHLERFAVFGWKHFPPQHPWFPHKSHHHYVIKRLKRYYTLSTSLSQKAANSSSRKREEWGLNMYQKNERWSSQCIKHLMNMGCVEGADQYLRFYLYIQSAYTFNKMMFLTLSFLMRVSWVCIECIMCVLSVFIFLFLYLTCSFVPFPQGKSRYEMTFRIQGGKKTAQLTW